MSLLRYKITLVLLFINILYIYHVFEFVFVDVQIKFADAKFVLLNKFICCFRTTDSNACLLVSSSSAKLENWISLAIFVFRIN